MPGGTGPEGGDDTGGICRLTVKLYEAMSGKLAEVPKQNPFRDTQDPEVLKAYGLGFVTGLTEDTFGGEEPVTREQAAVMLTAVYQYRNEDNRKAFLLWAALYGQDNDLNDDSNPHGAAGVEYAGRYLP